MNMMREGYVALSLSLSLSPSVLLYFLLCTLFAIHGYIYKLYDLEKVKMLNYVPSNII